MSQQCIDIQQDFNVPVERVFAYLGEHENLAQIFKPARIRRLSDGQGARNGVGSAREISLPLAFPFVETVTAYQENKFIEYRITKGSPLKNHLGRMRFEPTPAGCRLHYTITFEGKLPLIAALIKPGLALSIKQGLKTLRC